MEDEKIRKSAVKSMCQHLRAEKAAKTIEIKKHHSDLFNLYSTVFETIKKIQKAKS